MKIRILNAEKMGVEDTYDYGDIVHVSWDGAGDEWRCEDYFYPSEWKDKYFEIIEEDSKMNQSINNVKIRVNNPDHSKAIQEWLFERGCEWRVQDTIVKLTDSPFLYVGSSGEDYEITHGVTWEVFAKNPNEELALQHLDPHLQKPLKETVKIHTQADSQYSQANMMQKHLKHLSQLEHAIERHDNKQNKRRQERQKLLEMINKEMPKRVRVVTDETEKPF